jgi:TRAF-type zinc finger
MESIVEIDENERYWIGNGFGKGGLLLNDRGAFSTTDGSISWKTTDEVCDDVLFLGRGWSFPRGDNNSEDDFVPTRQNHDGWLYAADFRPNNIADAKPNRGNLHWVRFRRLIRIKTFHPEAFVCQEIYEKCDHCDSVQTDALSTLLIDVIAYASLISTSKAHVTDAVLLPLKKAVIDIAIGHELLSTQQIDVSQELNVLRKEFMLFIEKERSKYAMSRLISGDTFPFADRDKHSEFHERCATVAARCLPKNERDAIAGLIVRKLDRGYQIHCDKVNCGDKCVFLFGPCPNQGCPERMSKIHLVAHDAVCKYKAIACECGETVKAGDMPAHRSDECKFRLVECPFQMIGCTKTMRSCDLEQHIAEDMAAHLLLAVTQINAQKKEIVGLNFSLQILHAENQALVHSINQQKENMAVKIDALNERVTTMDQNLGDFESSCRQEIKVLKSPKRSVT